MQTQGLEQSEIPHAAALVAFTEAVVERDPARVEEGRKALQAVLSAEALVDAAAIVAAFHGFVRVADAIGIPYTHASGGRDLPELREQAGVNAFYRARNSG